MALIPCPECNKEVSTSASSCPHCGYPISHFDKAIRQTPKDEIAGLTKKIKACEFTCPKPRALVCIKCGRPARSKEYPRCECKINGEHYPFVEVDYPAAGVCAHEGVDQWIYENCVIPRDIGDTNSNVYQKSINVMYQNIKTLNASGRRNIRPIPPNHSLFGVEPTREKVRQYLLDLLHQETITPLQSASANLPTCPICHSTNLTKLSSARSFLKIATFGLAGAGDVGKTWKCNNCGSKF